jgi:phage tail sheath protein FI
VYRAVTMDKTKSQYVVSVVNNQSSLITLTDATAGQTNGPTPNIPAAAKAGATQDVVNNPAAATWLNLGGGADGDAPGTSAWATSGPAILLSGFAALDRMAPYTFSLMCIPAAAELQSTGDMSTVYAQAIAYCETYMAFLLIDIPRAGATSVPYTDPNSFVTKWYSDPSIQVLFSDHAAVYFPRLQLPDPLNGYNPRSVASSGTLAGIYSRTDANRGVWKAPAGTETNLVNATVEAPANTGIPINLTDQENGGLNPYGINAIRNFPIFGTVSWGARTLNGADAMASQWKYISVRRIALYIEQSLYQGSKWIVFEPNDEPLWGEIRKTFTAFMQSLFVQQAFQGSSPSQAYFVRCDGSTTTQADIDAGVVNILVGFAPLIPAEFVVISIQQIAGQASS